MLRSSWGRLVAAALTAVTAVGLAPLPVSAATDQVERRVVWDDDTPRRPGLHLFSAELDGSGRQRLFTSKKGFATALVLDRRGRRVAFAPCCQASLPLLVVVPVLGGKALRPLARHPAFYFVGGIGWSPDGRRLVFEGDTDRGGVLRSALWTVRPDGSGLRRLLRLPAPRSNRSFINDALGWTRAGVLYSDGHRLRVASGGTSTVLLRRVRSVRVSGNGRRMVLLRPTRNGAWWWVGNVDGSGLRRVAPFASADRDRTSYWTVTPGFGGGSVLAVRVRPDPSTGGSYDVVRWRVADGPSSATVVTAPGRDVVVTWN